ncbi:MAG: hypothetical protein PWQ29_1684 [Verrucomicrobiota bacterium]|jgi:uncharacterized LabA/DUF88 family protein|nr:hypothetical protein [Verrucomicrobiota bacterium]MDK2964290.1 hypothetical protein [Verrucomicrobiota bacterium]
MSEDAVAVYWDFENIHASLFDAKNGSGAYHRQNRFTTQEMLVDVQAIYDFAATYGNISINKAYCHWQWYSKYRHALLKTAVELIQIFPPGASAKNGADIKLSLDALDDVLRFSYLSSIVVVGGDSDFIPLAQKIKAAGKELIGVGCKGSTNQHWANSCSEFKYYESLMVEGATVEEEAEGDKVVVKDAAELITRAMKQIVAKSGDEWVLKAAIRPVVKRLDPTFDEANYGCKTFGALLKKYPNKFKVKKGEHDHLVSLID